MFDETTPRLGLPYVVAAQAQKHIPINESLARLDGLVQLAVESRVVATQPASPVAGGVWILPAGATGAVWAGQPAGVMMRFEAGAWEALVPAEGVLAWVKDENQMVAHDGVAWAPLSASFKNLTAAASPGLANTRMEIREEEATVLGATTSTAIVIPARAIVLAVSTRTTVAVAGATVLQLRCLGRCVQVRRVSGRGQEFQQCRSDWPDGLLRRHAGAADGGGSELHGGQGEGGGASAAVRRAGGGRLAGD
jgi:hypothetical protein